MGLERREHILRCARREDAILNREVLQTVMLPNGDVIKTRQRSRKSSAGWDTTKMFVGNLLLQS